MKKRLLMIILVLFLAPLFACSNEKAMEGSIYAFGTFIEIKIKANKDNVMKNYDDIRDIFFEYETLCDAINPRDINNVYTIDNSDDFVLVDSKLIDVINYALSVKDETLGHFNPLVGNISDTYKEVIYGERGMPTEAEVNTLLEELNSSRIVIDGNKVKIEGNAKLDLGGIAKGYALSVVKEYIIQNGIKYYLINAGSSSLAMGEKNGTYFAIGLMYDSSKTIYIKNGDLGCASINEQKINVDDGVVHHIVNPLTARPAKEHVAVYLVGSDSKKIDAYATAFMSMELGEIGEICLSNGLEYIIFDSNGEVFESHPGSYYEFN